jgi:hypothetical protein
VPEFHIVDEALSNGVGKQLEEIRCTPVSAKLRSSRFWERRRPRHLVSGRIHCGTCGTGVMAAGRYFLRCRRAQDDADCARHLYVKRGRIAALILDDVRHNPMQPDTSQLRARPYRGSEPPAGSPLRISIGDRSRAWRAHEEARPAGRRDRARPPLVITAVPLRRVGAAQELCGRLWTSRNGQPVAKLLLLSDVLLMLRQLRGSDHFFDHIAPIRRGAAAQCCNT